jgi:hypothetical protein
LKSLKNERIFSRKKKQKLKKLNERNRNEEEIRLEKARTYLRINAMFTITITNRISWANGDKEF